MGPFEGQSSEAEPARIEYCGGGMVPALHGVVLTMLVLSPGSGVGGGWPGRRLRDPARPRPGKCRSTIRPLS